MIVKNEEDNPEADSDSVSEINEDNILIDVYKALNNSVLPALFVLILSIVITYLMKIYPYTGYDSNTITTAPDIPTRFIHPIETQESHKRNLKASKSIFKLNNDITTLQHHNHHIMSSSSSSSSLSSSSISHTHPPTLLLTGITISIVINVHSESNDDELTIESQFRLSQLYMDILHMTHPPDCIFDYQLISEDKNNNYSNKVHEDKDQSSMTVTTTSSSSSSSSSRSDTNKHTTASSPQTMHQYGYAAHFSYGDSYVNNNPLSSSSPFSSVKFHREKEWLHTQVIQEMKRIARDYQVLYITIYSPHIYSDLAIKKKENKESINNNFQNDSADSRIQVPPTIIHDTIKDKAEEKGEIEIDTDIDDDYTYITPQSSTTSTTTNPTAASTTTSTTTTTTTNNNMDNIHVDILNKLDFNYMMLIKQIEPTRSGYQHLRTTTPVRRVLSSEQRQNQDNQNHEDLLLSSIYMYMYMNQCYNQNATQRRRQLYSQQQQ